MSEPMLEPMMNVFLAFRNSGRQLTEMRWGQDLARRGLEIQHIEALIRG
jgi:hypothetical protein